MGPDLVPIFGGQKITILFVFLYWEAIWPPFSGPEMVPRNGSHRWPATWAKIAFRGGKKVVPVESPSRVRK